MVHLPFLLLGALAGAVAVGLLTATAWEHVGVVFVVQGAGVGLMLWRRDRAYFAAGAGVVMAAGIGWPSVLPAVAGLTGFAAVAVAHACRVGDGARAAVMLGLPLAVLGLQTAGAEPFQYMVPLLLVGTALVVAVLRAPDLAWRGLHAVAGTVAVFFVFM